MAIVWTILLLVISNFFMLMAWYGHLKDLADKPWFIAVLVSWGIAFFEYPHSSACESNRLRAFVPWATQNSTRGNHPVCVCPFCLCLYETRAQMGLPLGGTLHVRCRLFRISKRLQPAP